MILSPMRLGQIQRNLSISYSHQCIPRIGQHSIRVISQLIMSSQENQDKKDDSLNKVEKINMIFRPESEGLIEKLELNYLAIRDKEENKWLDFDKRCYIYLFRGGGLPRDTIAAFDLDHTIIKPKGRSRIPKSSTDWEFFSVWTKQKIEQTIREENSRFLIFTNQYGVGLGKVSLDEVQERIELVTKRINIPCTVFMATEMDEFRKPGTHMYHLFNRAFNDNVQVDLHKSFYCGDAAGYYQLKSHSDADIKFAKALNLPFLTPDKFIRGCEPKLMT